MTFRKNKGLDFISGSQSEVSGQRHRFTWSLLAWPIPWPHSDLLNQKPWWWGPAICVLTALLVILMDAQI